MTEYTPTTDDVRTRYTDDRAGIGAWTRCDESVERAVESANAEFDRWYAAEIARAKAEALREAAEAMRLAKEPGHRYLLDLLDADVASSPDVWLERRAALLAKEADQ